MSDTENAFVRLQAEWTMLNSRRGLADTVRGWLVEYGLWEAGSGVAGPDELLAELKQRSLDAAPDPFGDRWMAALLRRSWQGGAVGPIRSRERSLCCSPRRLPAAGLSAGGVEEMAGARGELMELLLWALREQVLEPAGARAVADHYRQGALGDEAAARAAGVSHAAWRQRRSRAVRRLRTAAPQWLEQAA